MDEKLISAQQATQHFGISYQQLNHYTNLDLIQVVLRRGNTRFYDFAALQYRLQRILELMNEGYPLRLIHRKLFEPTAGQMNLFESTPPVRMKA